MFFQNESECQKTNLLTYNIYIIMASSIRMLWMVLTRFSSDCSRALSSSRSLFLMGPFLVVISEWFYIENEL